MANLTAGFSPAQKVGDEIRLPCAAVKNYHGGAAAFLFGTGYATPLVVATAAMAFAGVYMEGKDNSGGVAGDLYVMIARRGIFEFNQSGLTLADVGKAVYFTDDNTVSITPQAAQSVFAGIITNVNQDNGKACVDIEPAVRASDRKALTLLAVNGAINPNSNMKGVITKAGVYAGTLAAPTALVDDGVEIEITSDTANAHTLTTVNLLDTGSASVAVATFAAQKGAGLRLMAYNGRWKVMNQIGITFS